MISIITRCRNRLEYTAQVLDAVKRRTKIPYEHIIVDNASSDGTKEWFAWMNKNSWYENIKYVRMERNCGDWGGMLAGASVATGEFIVQLDNDIIPCEGWLTALHSALVGTNYDVMMLRRANVYGEWILKPLSQVRIVGGLEVVRIERPVACYMMRTEDFNSLHISESQGARSKYMIARKFRIGKILNRTCTELEADRHLIESGMDQRSKYPPSNKQIWEKV